MKKTDTRAFVPPLPLARPTASRTQAFRATALREVRRRPPTVVRPGMFVPHFSQRRTVSRGACICSSASRSRRRFPTAAAAPPAPALPIARWRTCLIVAAPFGRRTPAAHYSVACSSGREVHFPYRCGILRLTDRDAHRAAAPRGSRTPAPGLQTGGAPALSLRHPSADRTRCPLSGRRPSARRRPRPIITWRSV